MTALLVVALCATARTVPSDNAMAAGPVDWTGDLSPIAASDWSYERAAHLIERAGFGAAPDEVARLAALTPRQAVDELVDYESIANDLKPFDESVIWDPGMDPFPPSRAEAVRIARERGVGLGEKVLPEGAQRRLQPVVDKFFYGLYANAIETQRLGLWWANRMFSTRRPLEEKLTLFWHGHFATGENKVRDYRMMIRQNEMLRARASGAFRDLLVGILKDPAMLVYLDNGENVKKHPNENFGRELLELFTMGVGNYTERDVREAARAFTGWTNDVLAFRFDADQHDFGQKTFLGRTGTFDGEDIIDAILAQPVTAEFVAAKVYRFFVRDEIAGPVKADLGRTYRDSGYQMKPLLKRIFLSKDFYSPSAFATQIKSPVHLVVSTYRKMSLGQVPTIPDFGRMTSGLGQSLFDPPNVAGWAGGRTWITPSTLLNRGNLFRSVLFPDVKGFRPPDRAMSATDARVGQRFVEGLSMTEATREDVDPKTMAESNMMVDRDEDYNTRYGGYKGNLLAFERTKLIPRSPAKIDLTAMVRAAGADTVDKVVDHFVRRFLSVTLGDRERGLLVEFLRGKLGSSTIQPGGKLEESLRELLYLVLSAPEYQMG
ncbi:MAG: DUF1800 domain-containing protein [Acidobacteria bacterium]|nr:MAG: DUF1800 domain-containing protein [Acidobacteriota bacterium]PYQ82450.1 MAG: DUF1800 domain-containing protein [Acidobacteriota bacterium]PYQ90411.1 MAG: DUF1800 domain-containing protein [Acidobacteriota bacterium]PYR09352.1 MAG: DUF1800 domain-containing protein [Acidobacteriota bacterium]